ncbi:Ankyrin repeat, partial [Musa troglodytarum]
SYYPLARPANRKALTPLHYAVQGSHLELIEYLVRKGASVTAMTKAGQTPIDRVSTDEVRALLVECKQPLTKDDKSTTIMEVGDSKTMEALSLKRQLISDAEVTAKLDGHEGVDVVPSQESSSGHISSSLLLWSTVSVVILLLSVCRSADSESKPEGRQARKQRKKEAIRARLIVPQPQAVMSLEQTVSEKCLLERRDAIRSKCRGNCRSSSSLEATRAQLTDFDLPPSGLMGNGQSGLRREELGAEGGAVAGTHQGLGFQLYQEGRGVAEDSSRLLLDLNVKGSSGEMLGGSQNPNAGVGNQLLESDSALAETSDAVMVRIESMLPTV